MDVTRPYWPGFLFFRPISRDLVLSENLFCFPSQSPEKFCVWDEYKQDMDYSLFMQKKCLGVLLLLSLIVYFSARPLPSDCYCLLLPGSSSVCDGVDGFSLRNLTLRPLQHQTAILVQGGHVTVETVTVQGMSRWRRSLCRAVTSRSTQSLCRVCQGGHSHFAGYVTVDTVTMQGMSH